MKKLIQYILAHWETVSAITAAIASAIVWYARQRGSWQNKIREDLNSVNLQLLEIMEQERRLMLRINALTLIAEDYKLRHPKDFNAAAIRFGYDEQAQEDGKAD